jgi:hypothetical protein
MSDTTEKKVLLTVSLEVKQMIADLAVTKKAIADLRSEQKGLDQTTEAGRKQYEAYGAEIRNLTATAKEQQKTIDNTIKSQQAQKESNDQLKAQLSLLTAEYNKLSKEQKNSADGTALRDSIKGIATELKKTEGGLGDFHRTIGEYKNNIMSALGLSDGFAGKLTGLATGGKEAGKALITEGVSGVKAFGTSLLSLLANPIVAILAAIAVTVMMVAKAMESNGEVTNKVNQIMAPFKVILEIIVNIFTQFVSWLLSGVQAIENLTLAIAKYIPGLDVIAEKSQQAIELEKEKQALSKKMREQLLTNSKEELEIAELRNKSRQKDKFSIQERLKFLQEADALELKKAKEIADNRTEKFELRKKEMAEEGKTYKMLTKEEKDAYVQLQVDINNAKTEYFTNTMRLKSQEAQLVQADAAEKKAANDKIVADAKEAAKKREEIAKALHKAENDLFNISQSTISQKYKEIVEDTKKSYSQRILALSDYEANQIKTLQTNAEFEISQNKLTGKQKLVVLKKLEQDISNLKRETEKGFTDIEKQQLAESLKNYKASLEKKKQELSNDQSSELNELSRKYAAGKIGAVEYEKEKLDIAQKYRTLDFNASLDLLSKELKLQNLSAEQRAEIEKQISDTKIKYANDSAAIAIKSNEDIAKSHADAAKKQEEVEKELTAKKKELYAQLAETFRAIGDGMFDYKLQQLDDEVSAVTNSQSDQKAAVDEKEKAGTISKQQAEKEKERIDKEAKTKTDALEKEKRKATRDKAIFDRAASMFNIGVSTVEEVGKITLKVAELTAAAALNPLLIPSVGTASSMIPVAIGIGALQEAAMMASPLPKASRGLLLKGPSHAQGGIPIEAEGGEAIINKRSTAMFAPILSMLNEAGGGTAFAHSPTFNSDGGFASRQAVSSNALTPDQIQTAMEKAVAKIKVAVAVEDYRKADQNYTKIQDRSNY